VTRGSLVLTGALAVSLAACDGAEKEPPRVVGTVTYRERIALTPGSVIRVTLEDTSRADAQSTLVAATRIRSAEQPPIAFSLEYDPSAIDADHSYVVRAEIRDAEGALRWTSSSAQGVLTHGHPAEVEIVVQRVDGVATEARTVVWVHPGGPDVVVRMGPGEIGLFLPDRYAVLPQVPAASGAKYAEGDLVFWTKGDEATLEIGDERRSGLRRDAAREPWEDARLRGAAFRAAGNEPGWHLEIVPGGQITFVGDYGATSVSAPAPAPEVDRAGARAYRTAADGQELRVAIEAADCADSMSGESFSHRVTVVLDDREFRGCGRELGPPFAGSWKLAGFADGGEPVASSPPALSLDAWGAAAGSTGCNSFHGSWIAGLRPSLAFGPLAATMRACDEPLAAQESRFLVALARASAYRLSGSELRLVDEGGETLLVFARAAD